jgi:hypothetical protein
MILLEPINRARSVSVSNGNLVTAAPMNYLAGSLAYQQHPVTGRLVCVVLCSGEEGQFGAK